MTSKRTEGRGWLCMQCKTELVQSESVDDLVSQVRFPIIMRVDEEPPAAQEEAPEAPTDPPLAPPAAPPAAAILPSAETSPPAAAAAPATAAPVMRVLPQRAEGRAFAREPGPAGGGGRGPLPPQYERLEGVAVDGRDRIPVGAAARAPAQATPTGTAPFRSAAPATLPANVPS